MKHYIFDLDGTLIDSMPIWKDTGKNFLLSHGFTPPDNLQEIVKSQTLYQTAEHFQQELGVPFTAEEITSEIISFVEEQYRTTIPLKPFAKEFLEKEKKNIHLIALLDTLEYLKKGGRISKTAALAGNVLSIKPVVGVVDGEVIVLGKARGSRQGNNLLAEKIKSSGGIDFQKPYFLGYTGLTDALIQKYITDNEALWKEHVKDLSVTTVGGTIGTHVGPGGIAVAYFAPSPRAGLL